MNISNDNDLDSYFKNFYLLNQTLLFDKKETSVEKICINGTEVSKYINEYWTSGQRQASAIHEISYRACFKAELPRFFINLLTREGDTVYDPFIGRGTTIIEAALLMRQIIGNDINPLSKILVYPRLNICKTADVEKRLNKIPRPHDLETNIDLSMFYHKKTASEIIALKDYFEERKQSGKEDVIDKWIRMVATNRLTGHSPGFFSVYTLPPNQAVTQESQEKINIKRNQIPEYRDTHRLILNKTISLLSDLTIEQINQINSIGRKALLLTNESRNTKEIESERVNLTVTSPPFLDIVQYSQDNWLRCWFNSIDVNEISKNITIVKDINTWSSFIGDTFKELFRITKRNGWVAFEVGELRKGTIKLDEFVVPIGIKAGFKAKAIIINEQKFTKTSNIWGIKNNKFGTNSNRIVLFRKE